MLERCQLCPFNLSNICLFQDKIVVGHALHHDFKVLGLNHPPQLVRDTCKYIPLQEMLREKCGDTIGYKCSLKIFSQHLLGGFKLYFIKMRMYVLFISFV